MVDFDVVEPESFLDKARTLAVARGFAGVFCLGLLDEDDASAEGVANRLEEATWRREGVEASARWPVLLVLRSSKRTGAEAETGPYNAQGYKHRKP